ncbi:MAG: hypothetical protein NT157_02445 [Candidatus Micrarchaeota archaeon]|nr:hypothetical protein [Candidatus Micrarchaeota archaeon]
MNKAVRKTKRQWIQFFNAILLCLAIPLFVLLVQIIMRVISGDIEPLQALFAYASMAFIIILILLPIFLIISILMVLVAALWARNFEMNMEAYTKNRFAFALILAVNILLAAFFEPKGFSDTFLREAWLWSFILLAVASNVLLKDKLDEWDEHGSGFMQLVSFAAFLSLLVAIGYLAMFDITYAIRFVLETVPKLI